MEIKKVLANVKQKLEETEKSTARKNIGVTADLLKSTDESMTFTDIDADKIGIALNGYDTVAGNGIVIDTDDLNHTFSIRTSETYDTVVDLDTTLASGKYKLADNAGGTGPDGVDLTHGTLTVATSVSYTDTAHIGNQMVSDAYQMLITADGVPYYRTYNGKTKEFTEWVAGFGPKGDNIYLDEAKTTVMYTASTSDRTPKSIDDPSWSTTIPSVDQGQYLWVRTILAFSDESTADPIYNVVYKAKDIELDTEKTKVEYGTSTSGTDSTSVIKWTKSIPSVQQGQYLWVRTTLAFTDESTADPIYNVVYQPKDIKLDTDNTKVEYGIAKSKDATPSSWSPSVPAINQGDYLWVRTTMYFSDGSVAPAFCHVIYEPKDIKINSTTFRYASATSGTETPPSSSFSTTMPSVTQGDYLWTESVLNFSDGTSSSPYYSAVYQPKDINLDTAQTTVKYGKSTSSTTEPAPSSWTTSIPSLRQGDYLWTKTTLTFSDGNSAPDIKQCVYQPKDINFNSATITYATGKSGTTAPADTEFNAVIPSVSQGEYLWIRTILNFSDGNSSQPYDTSVYYPKDGINGEDVYYESSSTKYCVNTSATEHPAADSSDWKDTWSGDIKGKYLWSKTTWSFTTGGVKSTSSPMYTVTYQPVDGTDGNSVTVKSSSSQYCVSTSGVEPPTAGWSTTDVVPTVPAGQFLWTKTTTTFNETETSIITYAVGYHGLDGSIFTAKGEYSSSTNYAVNDFVTYNGSSYVCIKSATNQEPTNPTYWQLIAKAAESYTLYGKTYIGARGAPFCGIYSEPDYSGDQLTVDQITDYINDGNVVSIIVDCSATHPDITQLIEFRAFDADFATSESGVLAVTNDVVLAGPNAVDDTDRTISKYKLIYNVGFHSIVFEPTNVSVYNTQSVLFAAYGLAPTGYRGAVYATPAMVTQLSMSEVVEYVNKRNTSVILVKIAASDTSESGEEWIPCWITKAPYDFDNFAYGSYCKALSGNSSKRRIIKIKFLDNAEVGSSVTLALTFQDEPINTDTWDGYHLSVGTLSSNANTVSLF